MDPNSEARLAQVMPALAVKIRAMAAQLAAEGVEIRVCQGLRSWTQQNDLYAQGRTKPGPIVTNCPGGHSWHNFGMAVDCVPMGATGPDWNLAHPTWKQMVAAGEALGLNCGADWRTFKDWPHFQLTGRFPTGAPDDEARQLWKDGGMQAIWAESGVAQ